MCFGVGAGEDQRLFSVSLDHSLKIFDIPSKHVITSITFPSFLTSIAVHHLDEFVCVGAGDNNIY